MSEMNEQLRDAIQRKGRWMLELSRRTDPASGQITPEDSDEAKRAAGIPEREEGDE